MDSELTIQSNGNPRKRYPQVLAIMMLGRNPHSNINTISITYVRLLNVFDFNQYSDLNGNARLLNTCKIWNSHNRKKDVRALSITKPEKIGKHN